MSEKASHPNSVWLRECRRCAGHRCAAERGTDEPSNPGAIGLVLDNGGTVVIPAPVIAQAWRGGVGRQTSWVRLLKRAAVVVEELTLAEAKRVGMICRAADTSDVVDAAVVAAARKHGFTTVLTTDPDDLARLDGGLQLIAL